MLTEGSCPMENVRGFTLVELLVTVTVLGVLLGVGMPNLFNLIEQNRLTTDANNLVVSLNYARSEAARVLLTASSHDGMQADDRAYLVRLVAARTGIAGPDAERRVNEVVARAEQSISRAQRSAVILAFMIGAAALVGAAVAWLAACAGGAHRDGRITPHALLDWGRAVRRF